MSVLLDDGGVLVLGIAEVEVHAGEFKEAFIVGSTFIGGFFVTYVKLSSKMKSYEYGCCM